MNIRYITLFLNSILMILLPLGLAILWVHKWKLTWRLFWIGAAGFILSQVAHIPFNLLVSPVFNNFSFLVLDPRIQIIIKSLFLGLSAGVFEESSRYIVYRWWAKSARSWNSGMLLGIGHGGIEAILLGGIALYGYIRLVILSTTNPSFILSASQIPTVNGQLSAALSMPVALTLLGAVERGFALCIHLACSLLVLQVFTQGKIRWLFISILFHALVDGIAVYAQQIGLSVWIVEGLVGLLAIVSLLIILSLKKSKPRGRVESGLFTTN